MWRRSDMAWLSSAGTLFVRAGYAAAAALVAVLASWAVSGVVTTWSLFASLTAMGAACMIMASFKPLRGTSASSVLEALLVALVVFAVWLGTVRFAGVDTNGLISKVWWWQGLNTIECTGFLMFVVVSWILGSDRRVVDRPAWLLVAEFTAMICLGALGIGCAVIAWRSPLSGAIIEVFLVLEALLAALMMSQAVCMVNRAFHGDVDERGRSTRHQGREPLPPSKIARMACLVLFGLSVSVSVVFLAVFFSCAQFAGQHGLELRNAAYNMPSIWAFLTCFVVAPLVAIQGVAGKPKDYRIVAAAVCAAFILLMIQIGVTFRLEVPEEREPPDGTLEITTPVWLDKARVTYAKPEGRLFMRMLPEERTEAGVLRAQGGYSYHNTGVITAIDAQERTLELVITDSTEGLEKDSQVIVDCASTEYFDVPFDELVLGDAVQIRSTEEQVDGTIVAQKVFMVTAAVEENRGQAETLDEVLEELSCPYTISGTVTSSVEENGFEFRVDDGGGIIENGTELHVSTVFVERRMYGMKGLQWGMDGVIIGFSDLPAEGILRAKVIVGNDNTSSDYWENMEVVH